MQPATILAFGLIFGLSLARLQGKDNRKKPDDNDDPPPFKFKPCVCIPENVWMDVVFVVDASNHISRSNLEDVVDSFLRGPMSLLTLDGGWFGSRVAVVSYSSDASIESRFGEIIGQDDIYDFDIPYRGDDGTNITSGLSIAVDLLKGSGPHTVIYLISSAYTDDATSDPVAVADAYKAKGGTLVTLEVITDTVNSIPILNTLASPGYSFSYLRSAGNYTAFDVIDMLCHANCYCGTGYTGYSTNPQGSPDGGCVRLMSNKLSYEDAKSSCTDSLGNLVGIHDSGKQGYVDGLLPPRTPYWIGLQKNSKGDYAWADDTDYNTTYQNWSPNQPTADGSYVYSQQYSGFNSGWFASDGTQQNQYVCETMPCDTMNYDC